MSRKAVKLILFIFGAAIAVFWSVLFFSDMMIVIFDIEPLWQGSFVHLILICIAAVVPMSIAMLLHAKDIKHKKKGFAVFLIVLSIFWLSCSALNLTGIVVVKLIFG